MVKLCSMDGVSTAVVVLIFVATILTSLGNQGYTPPRTVQAKPPAQTFNMPQAPNPDFTHNFEDNARPAINKLVGKYRNDEEAKVITASIIKYSKQFNVNPKLVAALMARESRFNPRAVSSSGAVGLGQLMPATWKTVGISNAYDINENAKGTVRYIRYLLDRFSGLQNRVALAIGGYLQGPNAIARQGLVKPHTKAYVRDIFNIYHKI
ncbi:lytic transglycosylase domain-containing protein [Candidatus Margulisiibacteriota bacterium]